MNHPQELNFDHPTVRPQPNRSIQSGHLTEVQLSAESQIRVSRNHLLNNKHRIKDYKNQIALPSAVGELMPDNLDEIIDELWEVLV